MEPERLEKNSKEKDVFQRNAVIEKMQEIYKKIEYCFSTSMIKLGTCITNTMLEVARKIKGMLGGVFSWFKQKSIIAMGKIGDFLVDAIHKIAFPIANRKQCADEIRINLNKARKLGKKEFVKEVFKCVGKFYSGAGGVLSTLFNHAAPVISVAFLIGIVHYVSGLEYGLSVEYNGQEIGIVNEETDFDTAAKEVQKRIANADVGTEMNFTPQFSLKVLNNKDEFVNSSQLADNMLSNSDAELTEAYGVYIDNEFVGAVIDKNIIDQGLSGMLSAYETGCGAQEVRFQKKLDYREGIYLTDSLTKESDLMNLLKSSKKVDSTYTVAENDTPILIAEKCNMTLEDLTALNPDKINALMPGDVLNIKKTESYLPIEYTRVLQTTTYIDYNSVEVESNKIYKGHTAVLTEGVRGEQTNVVNVYYTDGMETTREVVSSQVTKEPVTEEIGVGIYTAKPSSASTVISGSGQFCWPVDGGYISDTFGGERGHKGIDIAAPSGTSIYAAADGVVIYAGWDSGGYGNCIRIDHGNGYVTVYGHESSICVEVGQTVSCGDLIGGVGTTGDSTGNHLHFEVRDNGIAYNPEYYINVN